MVNGGYLEIKQFAVSNQCYIPERVTLSVPLGTAIECSTKWGHSGTGL